MIIFDGDFFMVILVLILVIGSLMIILVFPMESLFCIFKKKKENKIIYSGNNEFEIDTTIMDNEKKAISNLMAIGKSKNEIENILDIINPDRIDKDN